MANALLYYLIVINVVTFLVYGIDKWECPSPRDCCCQGKYNHPHGALEYGRFRHKLF